MGIIGLRKITKRYKSGGEELVVVNRLDLDVEKGELLAICGESGSGKSTLMNIIGTLDSAFEGEYYLNGRSVRGYRDIELSRLRAEKIAFIFQSFNLIPTLTAQENIELALRYKKIKGKEAEEIAKNALINVGLYERKTHLPSQLSGGQQQRVAVARAVAMDTEILLADEPTGNLDSKTGSQIFELISGLSMSGKTVIIITHDKKIASLCNRCIYMSDGEIVG